jgi:hypothetical protein
MHRPHIRISADVAAELERVRQHFRARSQSQALDLLLRAVLHDDQLLQRLAEETRVQVATGPISG